MKNADEHKIIEYKTQEEILIRGNEAIGKTVRQIDKYGRVNSDGIKGGIGGVSPQRFLSHFRMGVV